MTETTEALEPQVCEICSALAADMDKHLDWHKRLLTDAGKAAAEAAVKKLNDDMGQAMMGMPG